jgi:hypothetical protein
MDIVIIKNDFQTLVDVHVPPNSLRDPKVGPQAKQQKKKRVGASSLTHSTSGVGGHVGASRWD